MICAVIIAAVMSCPYIGVNEPSIANAFYDLVCTIVIFPTIVYIGACGTTTDRVTNSLCEFMGRLSYPIYIIHYPVMYLFYAWVWANSLSFSQVWPVCVGLFALITVMATCALKYYDEPLRRYLTGLQSRNAGRKTTTAI